MLVCLFFWRAHFALVLVLSLCVWQMIDFGFAKVVHDKTYTVCGTPEYLAPELVLGKGVVWVSRLVDLERVFGFTQPVLCLCSVAHSVPTHTGHGKGVDYWAIGIFIYEMLVGSSPFADHQNGDQGQICRNIVDAPLRMPRVVPSTVAGLIRRLLHR